MLQDSLELNLVPLEEALERWNNEIDFKKAAKLTGEEKIDVKDSLRRITAEDVPAKVSYPNFFMSGIDGIAVNSAITFNTSASNPMKLRLGEEGFFVDNGRQLPPACDAVIPIEKVKFHTIDLIEIYEKITPWENVRAAGHEVTAHEIIIPKNYKIRSLDIGAMLSSGVNKIKVRKKPRVGIISAGDNLMTLGKPLKEGYIYESTSYILSNILRELGAQPAIYDIAEENLDSLNKITAEAMAEEDIVVIIGGRSRGTSLIVDLLIKTGELGVYGTCIKPGQSVCAGFIEGKCVVGLPHFPFSAFVAFEVFAQPVILKMLGLSAHSREKVSATIASTINSPFGIDEFMRVQLVNVGKKIVAVPVSRGADLLMSFVKADGVLRISKDISQISGGSIVEIELLTNRSNIDKNLIMMGTYDYTFNIIKNIIYKLDHKVNLHTYNIGSKQGLKAIKDGFAHFSGIHLFDSRSGDFNVPFVKEVLDGVPVIVLNLFHRYIGLVVKQGNPKNIKDLSDLKRADIKFINRNFGSGTRSIFDYALRKASVNPQEISGYAEESNNHMASAQAVASGSVDAALGIYVSAKALNLDFIPIMFERYDIVIPKKFLNDYKVQVLLHLINSEEFKKEVKDLQGYDFSYMGQIYYDSEEK